MELVGQGITLLQAHPWIPESFRIAYHLGAAEVAMMRGDQDVYSRFMRLVDAEMAPQTEPALSCMTALIQAKALQTAGRYAEHQLLQITDGRELPAAWLPRTRAEILLLELQAQMGKPHKVLPQLELLAHGNKVATSGASLALARAHLAAGDCDAGNRLLRRIITSHHAPPLPLLIEAMLLTAEVAPTPRARRQPRSRRPQQPSSSLPPSGSSSRSSPPVPG
jgi:ATP/maltotriose-dependent transcriptional regulator MalT